MRTMTKNFCTFSAAFIDDAVENEEGDIVVPAGKQLTTAISRAIPHSNEPSQHSFYGWTFSFRSPSGRKVSVLIQQPDVWLVIVTAHVKWYEWGVSLPKELEGSIKSVGKALNSVPEISDVKWFTEREYLDSAIQKRPDLQ